MPVGYTIVSASKLQDASGTLIDDALILFTPANMNGTPVSFRAGGTHGQVSSSPVSAAVTNGAFEAQLADTTLTLPANVGYRVTVVDNVSGRELLGPGYDCVQPSGETWSFDDYQPNLAGLIPVQYGPQGPSGTVAVGSVTTVAQGSSASVVNSGTPSNAVLNFTLPQGPPGPAGTTTMTGSTGSFAIRDAAFVKSYLIGLFGSYDAFGDSITFGYGASIPANNFVSRVGARLELTPNDHGVSGTGAAEQPRYIYPLNISDSAYQLFTLAVGLNDASKYYIDGANARNFQGFHMASAAALAVTSSKKLTGQGAVTRTGSWSNNPYYGGAMGTQSQTHADTVTFSVNGAALYIAMTLDVGNAATYSLAVDGVLMGNFACSGFNDGGNDFTTNNGNTYGSFLHRFGNLADGSHTVVITVTSATGAGYVKFDWAAGIQRSNHHSGGPTLVVGGVTYINTGLPASLIDTYSAMIKGNVLALAADGLNVVYSDSGSFLNPLTDLISDNIHPNDTGHSRLADAFLSALHSATDAPTKAAALFVSEINRFGTITSDNPLTFQSLSNGGLSGDLATNFFNRRSAGGTVSLNFMAAANDGTETLAVQLREQITTNTAGNVSSTFVISTVSGGVLTPRFTVDQNGVVSFGSDAGVLFQSASGGDVPGDYSIYLRNNRRGGGGNDTSTLRFQVADANSSPATGAAIQQRQVNNTAGGTSSRLALMTTVAGVLADRLLIDENGLVNLVGDAGPLFQSATGGDVAGDYSISLRNNRRGGGAADTTTLRLQCSDAASNAATGAALQQRQMDNTAAATTSRLALMTTIGGVLGDRVLIDETGALTCYGKLILPGGVNLTLNPPATSTSPGVQGDIRASDLYIYVCVAANTWKRVALSTDTW